MAAAEAQSNGTCGKKEMAALLGWSRPRLDRRLQEDPRFPVENRGDQSGGWRFDPEKVRAYLGNSGAPGARAAKPAKAAPPIDRAQLRDIIAPPPLRGPGQPAPSRPSAYHQGEATARQRKDEADAALREDKLRAARGELIERSEMRQALTTVMNSFGHDLDAIPEKIVKLCNLPEDAAAGVRAIVDEIRTNMVKRAEPLLSATEGTP